MRNYNDRFIEAFLEHELARLPLNSNGRMLDLGCGTRPYLPVYGKHFGSCIAGDFDQRTSDLDLRLDATALPFADVSFDLVLCSEVIEHVADAGLAIREISRVLKPGSVLLITWPFNYMIHESPNDYVRYTEFGMASVLQCNGLTVEAIVHRGGVFALSFTIVEFLIRNLLEAVVRIPGLGWAFRPVRAVVCWLALELPCSMVFLVANRFRLQRSYALGQGLQGWRGSLRRWTLGYCLRARKASA